MRRKSIVEIAKRIKGATRVNQTTATARKRALEKGKNKLARPKALKAKKGLSLERLVFYTPSNIIGNAKRDRVTIVSFRVSKSGNKIFSKTLTYDKTKGKLQVRPHRHWVEKDEPGKFKDAKRIKFNCDCEHYMFAYEYANNHHGAADIRFSNGEFPIQTNPRLRPGLCKHGYVLMRYIRANRL